VRFIYKESRDLEGITGDEGSTLRATAKVMADEGVAPSALFPWNPSRIDEEPNADVKAAAMKQQVTNYYGVNGLTDLKAALGVVQMPVMIGFTCFYNPNDDNAPSVFNPGPGGLIPIPNLTTDKVAGGHAVEACGFNDAGAYVTIKNSWGETWGENGYGRLPYWYWNKELVDDCQLIAEEEDLNPPLPPTPDPTPKTLCQKIKEWLTA
jgi:C1A family cysteine protease